MSVCHVAGVGLMAPGLSGWDQGREILAGRAPYLAEPLPRLVPGLLPANERRRTTPTIKLALQVAQEALEQSGAAPAGVASVFASSDGDMEIVDRICSALAQPDRPVSPTHFHNSVHNAPAGYWAIAAGATAPSTSISAFDASFAAGLLEAVTLVASERLPVLLVAYDYPAPAVLQAARPLPAAAGVALLLSPEAGFGRCAISMGDNGAASAMTGELETLRLANPAARALPLLAAIARGEPARLALEYLGERTLTVEYAPCM